MSQLKSSMMLVLMWGLFSFSACFGAELSGGVLGDLPAQDGATFHAKMESILRLGPAAWKEVCLKLQSNDLTEKTQAQYAVSGLVKYVSQNKLRNQRETVAIVLAQVLQEMSDKEQQAFLLEQLGLLGSPKSIEVVKGYIVDERLCDPACRALVSISGRAAESALLKTVDALSDPCAPHVINALGKLRSRRAIPLLKKYMSSSDARLRQCAVWALAEIGEPSYLLDFQRLIQDTNSAADPTFPWECYFHYASRLTERGRAREAQGLCKVVLDAPEQRYPSHVRCAALNGLVKASGKRALPVLFQAVESGDAAYRATALQHAQALRGAGITERWCQRSLQVDAEKRAEIIRMLGARNDKRAAPYLEKFIEDNDARVRGAAVNALVAIKDPQTVSVLIERLKVEQEPDVLHTIEAALLRLPSEQVTNALVHVYPGLGTKGKILANQVFGARPSPAGAEAVRCALNDADSEVRVTALEAIGKVGSSSDLPVLLERLSGAQSDAERKAAKTATVSLLSQVPDFPSRLAPLTTAWQSASGEAKAAIHDAIQTLCGVPDAEGFVCLFNGVDLTGWVGDTEGYVPENGLLVCKPGGNLYTEKEYGNFVFHFEFKLTPAANNGLAVRAPIGGGAYNGMEIQILDDYADVYKDLKPWQYHGSIYGIVPVKRGYLKPAGEWNVEQVIANGRRITVVLNGETVVDADLDQATKPQPMDGKLHEGLDREKGHLGFLGHGSVLEFRNIRIKEL